MPKEVRYFLYSMVYHFLISDLGAGAVMEQVVEKSRSID